MLDKVREEIARYRVPPHLVTAAADGRPHAVATEVAWQGERIVLAVGERSLANIASRPLVALLWSAPAPGDYSLIVDGEAAIRDGDGAPRVVIEVTRAVLHRPGAPRAPRNARCGSDCVPLYG